MKFTVVFITLLSISTVLAKRVEEPKDKREAPVGYATYGQSSGGYPGQSLGHGDASAISVGAGYSIGGAKPSYSFGGQGSGGAFQLSPEHLSSNGQQTIQLAPITLQPSHGSISSSDLSQLVGQISQGINANGLSFTPSNNVAEFHSTQVGGGHGGQELSLPQYTFGSPKLQQYGFASPAAAPIPAYASGSKGLSSYGATGPVLFTPSENQGGQPGAAYVVPSSGHSFGSSGALSFGKSGNGLSGFSLSAPSGLSYGGAAGHSLEGVSGYSLGDASGHLLGGASANSLGGSSGYNFGGAVQSLGSLKGLGSSYTVPSKTSFKPSAFLGNSVQSDSNHGLSSLSEQYSSPSFAGISSGSHGLSLGSGDRGASYAGSFPGFNSGSSYKLAPSFESVKGENVGAQLDGVASFSNSGHFASPSGSTYGGFPGSSYASTVSHAASSSRPHFVSSPKHSSGNFGEGSSSYRGPASIHSSFSSGPKFSYGGHSGSRYSSPRDSHGAHSETVYNTIKYSEDLKSHVH